MSWEQAQSEYSDSEWGTALKEFNSVKATDFTRQLGIGLGGVGKLGGRILDVVGLDKAGKTVEDIYDKRIAKLRSEQSPAFKAEMAKPFFKEDPEGMFQRAKVKGDRIEYGEKTYSPGPGFTSPTKIIGQTIESIPNTAFGVGTGVAVTQGLIKAGVSKGLAGIIGAAIGEGSVAGASSAKDAYDIIMSVRPDTDAGRNLYESDEFNAAFEKTGDYEKAKHIVARNSALKTGGLNFLFVAASGAPSGFAFGKLIGGETGKTMLRTVGKQAALEAFVQEMPQSAFETILQNIEKKKLINPDQDIYEGVPENVIGSTLSAIGLGGASGAFGHVRGKSAGPTKPDSSTKPEHVSEEATSSEPSQIDNFKADVESGKISKEQADAIYERAEGDLKSQIGEILGKESSWEAAANKYQESASHEIAQDVETAELRRQVDINAEQEMPDFAKKQWPGLMEKEGEPHQFKEGEAEQALKLQFPGPMEGENVQRETSERQGKPSYIGRSETQDRRRKPIDIGGSETVIQGPPVINGAVQTERRASPLLEGIEDEVLSKGSEAVSQELFKIGQEVQYGLGKYTVQEIEGSKAIIQPLDQSKPERIVDVNKLKMPDVSRETTSPTGQKQKATERAWVDNKWRPITAKRQITRGKQKGNFSVTFSDGRKKIVTQDAIKSIGAVDAIKDTLKGQTGSSQIATDIFNHGIELKNKGIERFKDFARSMKRKFADVWDKIKAHMRELWDILNNERGQISNAKEGSESTAGIGGVGRNPYKKNSGIAAFDIRIEKPFDKMVEHINKIDPGPVGIRAIGKDEVGEEDLKNSWLSRDDENHNDWRELDGTSVILVDGAWDYMPDDNKLKQLESAYSRVKSYSNGYGYVIVTGDVNIDEVMNDPGESVFKNAKVIGYIYPDDNPGSQTAGINGKLLDALKNEKGSSQLITDISSFGAEQIRKGVKTLQEFRAVMKERFAEIWDKIKQHMRQLWDVLNNQRGSIEFEGKNKKIDKETDALFEKYFGKTQTQIRRQDEIEAGKAAKSEGEKGEVSFDLTEPLHEFDESFVLGKEQSQRYKTSQGIKAPPLKDRVSEIKQSLKNKLTREYEHLPNTKEFAQAGFTLRTLAKQKDVASEKGIRDIRGILRGLKRSDYKLFSLKVVIDDIVESSSKLTVEEAKTKKMQFGLTRDAAIKAQSELDNFISENPKVAKALERRKKVWNTLKNDYIKSMKDIGFDVSGRLKRESYFRRQVSDYIELKGLYGTGKKLKTPSNRGYLKKRTIHDKDYNVNYLEAEHEIMAQMIYDMEIAKAIKIIDEKYNIEKQVRADAKEKGVDFEDAIPEGYTDFQPREGNVFFMADTIPANLAKKITEGALKEVGIKASDLRKVLAMGGKRRRFIIKKELAQTLDDLYRVKSQNPLVQSRAKILRGWKVWQLISARRYAKYNLRNITGDIDAVIAGNPTTFKKVIRSMGDIYNAYVKKTMSQDLQDFFDRGGMGATLQAQEMGGIDSLKMFRGLTQKKGKITDIPKKAWMTYWKAARMSTDAREALLRYASYLDYLDQMKASKDGLPKNYGMSRPEEVKGLSDIRDRAFMLSNDLLGAYDRISVFGQAMREQIYPFWSWKEANFKRYIQLFKNAANDGKLASAVGRKVIGTVAIKTPYMTYRIGSTIIKTAALMAVLQVWNNTKMKEEEKELPPDVRSRPHLTIGRDKDGNVIYFSRLGAVSDILEAFGLDSVPDIVNRLTDGEDPKVILKEMARSPVNVMAQGSLPFAKLLGETLTRRALFPDVFNPRTIRDRGLHLARSFGLENEYIALTKKPSRGYRESISKGFIYKVDPLQSAYSQAHTLKRKYLKKIGKLGEGFFLTPAGDALYNVKLSMKYGDKESARRYLKKYWAIKQQQNGGEWTPESISSAISGMASSFKRMDPLSGLSDKDKIGFYKSLSIDDKKTIIKAYEFYRQMFDPSMNVDLSKAKTK